MAVKSVYLPNPLIEDNTIHIDGEEHRHLMVGRAEAGEEVEVFDGKGNVWKTIVQSVRKRETIARINESHSVERDPLEVILGLAMIRIAAFELALEKAVEVGVTRIIPFTGTRSNAVPGNRHQRWNRILIEAAKQSKHYYIPDLDEPITFQEIISIPAASKVIFAEHDGALLLPELRGSPVLYLIGPEGGWTDQEVTTARTAGFHAVSLGTAILKAETAAIVGAALIRYEMGRLARASGIPDRNPLN
jgi:16S rRNA (uracil1498-N3)-methyltransferase